MTHSDPEATFVEVIGANPIAKAFRVVEPCGGEPAEWQLEPLDAPVLSYDGNDGGLFVIAALNILPDRRLRDCYMDISLPERINDYAYFVGEGLHHDYPHKFEGEIIPAIAIDCFGIYDLFYSKTSPEVGIEVLKRGLAVSKRKHFIAEDLGYIYRDENRYREAAEMFQLAANEEVSSPIIYGELAQVYGMIGESEKEQKYMELYNNA